MPYNRFSLFVIYTARFFLTGSREAAKLASDLGLKDTRTGRQKRKGDAVKTCIAFPHSGATAQSAVPLLSCRRWASGDGDGGARDTQVRSWTPPSQ
jgi:hypothetical protein